MVSGVTGVRPMSEKVRMPADLEQVSLKLLGKLDAKDLARLGTPSGSAFAYLYLAPSPSLAAFAGAAVAVAIGLTWALWRPYGRSIDQNLYQAFRWMLKTRAGVETPEIEEEVVSAGNSIAALIEVDPVNMELKSGDEKAALHKLYQDLLKTVDYKIEVYSTQRSFDFGNYLENLDEDDKLEGSYRRFCEGLTEDGQSRTRHFVCIRVSNGETAELENRVDEVLEELNSGGLTAHRVSRPEEVIGACPEVEYDHVAHPDSEEKQCSKTLYISEYPREVDFSWTTEVFQAGGLVDVTQVVRPKPAAGTVSRLQKLEHKAEAENESLVRKGYGSNRRLERLLGDVDWFQNLLADQDDQPVEYGVYITAYGSNEEECEASLRQVQNRLKTLGIKYRDTALRTDQAYCSTTPGHDDELDECLLVPAGSAASGFPFSSPSSVDESGVLFGVDQTTESPVILDRFSWNAGHQVLAGVTGSGKSFYSKLLLLRSAQIYEDLSINIVDPKPEYGEISEKLEQYATVTRFGLDGSIEDETDELIQAVGEAYKDAQQTDEKTLVVIDEAHRLLKREEGASILSTLVREARSSNTAVTLITQTVGDFYRTEDGEDILKNVPCKVLFAHEKTDDRPAQAFQLSTVAETRLYNLKKGDQDSADYSQAILAISNQLETEVKVEASDTEASIIEDEEVPEDDQASSENLESYDDIQETSSTISTEEFSLFEELRESIAEAISGIEKPSLPDFGSVVREVSLPEISFSSEEDSNAYGASSEEKQEEEEITNRSLRDSCLEFLDSALGICLFLCLAAISLIFAIAGIGGIIQLLAEQKQSIDHQPGSALFSIIVGTPLLYVFLKDVYSSLEESLSDYSITQAVQSTALGILAFILLAAFFVAVPLTIIDSFAQPIPDRNLRTGVYVGSAFLELGAMGKLGEKEEDSK